MQFRRSVGIGVLAATLLLTGIALGGVVWRYPESMGMASGSSRQTIWLSVISVATFIVAIFLGGYHLLGNLLGHSKYRQGDVDDAVQSAKTPSADSTGAQDKQRAERIRVSLRARLGRRWRQKSRLLLIVGEPEQIQAIAPGLGLDNWLEDNHTVLLWGGSVKQSLDDTAIAQYRHLTRWRGLDGIVWALNAEQSADAHHMGSGTRQLQDLAGTLGWSLPLHLWQVCASAWAQDKRPSQAVGCALPSRLTASVLENSLHGLLGPLRQKGWAQMNLALRHDFLVRLSRDLQVEGVARWRQALAPWFGDSRQHLPLRGLWFSLPLTTGANRQDETEQKKNHFWPMDPAWHGVLGAPRLAGRRLGWSVPRAAYALGLAMALLWGAGMLLSFASNRAQIAQVQTSLATLEQSAAGDEQLHALHELTRELARLDYRATHGTPWYQRFGLNQNDTLLASLWPRYVEANQRLLRDPAAANLQRQLKALIQLPPNSPERAKRAPVAYAQLKAYLMLARPDKTDPAFLAKVLGEAEPTRDGMSPGVWQALSPTLWGFYAEQLATHPQWRIDADAKLVAQARQVLLGQMGQRNGEASLYRQVLDAAANHYPALGLAQMVGETDARTLFASKAQVPGVFTRQAWEGQVRQAIDDIAQARREEIDWVLSDSPGDIAAELSAEALRERLSERYFQDYASAWLNFLNRLNWQPARSLDQVIEQLTLMSDVRQSPLIALMNTLAYQGQAGVRGEALADSLLKSAQKLMADDQPQALIDQSAPLIRGPLDATFGPLLSLLGKGAETNNYDERLSLQAFLTQVTRVRLKLQQVSSAADPQAMTQALAQTVFQGNSIDLTDTRAYGSLIAASLGAQWGGMGQTLFVAPLEQAWQRVLQPSAASLNRQWQRAIVNDWQGAFTGRYPFAATTSDASLPMLGQMIRADSGRLEQFLQQQLGGLLRKEGSRWVADAQHSQGLRINPQFLVAINQLSQLADVLFTDGGLGLGFELRAKPVRDVVQTTFILNGERLEYFNQKESWQRFSWPGYTEHPGVSLTWTSVHTGERLFGDYQGTWGLIRLMEQARVTPLDDGDSRYRLVLKAPDGLGLTWHLRTELGAGPLALLKLRDFKLPAQIFLDEDKRGEPYAQNGGYP